MASVFKKTVLILTLVILPKLILASGEELKEKAMQHYQQANLYYEQGKYKEAEQEYQAALQLFQKNNDSAGVSLASQKKENVLKPPAQEEYIIGKDDVLYISVWQNPDLSQEVIVRPDGRISFPLVGDVQAEGLTITQLDNELTLRLKEFVKFPEVSLTLRKMGGQKIIILGEVNKPGVISVTGAKTIMEAIGQAGGFTKDAVPSSAVLIRGGFLKPQAQRINLSRVFKGDLSQNVVLQAEDIVFIPKKFIANLNYFVSQILEPLSKGATVTKETQGVWW